MTDDEVLTHLRREPVILLALTAMGEARGDHAEGHSSVEERIAVMCVIRNRFLASRALDWSELILARNQFSCWNPDDPNRAVLLAWARVFLDNGAMIPDTVTLARALLVETRYLADGVYRGIILDRTEGALNYYAPAGMKPPGRIPKAALHPDGTEKHFIAIGKQHFYRA